jgi:hypothetical protein
MHSGVVLTKEMVLTEVSHKTRLGQKYFLILAAESHKEYCQVHH